MPRSTGSSGAVPAEALPVPRSAVRHLRWWRVVAALVLLAGVAGSLLAARSSAGQEVSRSHREFAATSTDVASRLQLALQREDDLNVSVGGFILGRPDAKNAEFLGWSADVQAFKRYPELVGFGFTAIVPAAQLAGFAARALTDPVGSLGPDGSFQVMPPGARPFYCLAELGQMRPGSPAIPSGYDFCAADPSLDSRDSGVGSYTPLDFGGHTVLVIETPMYRGGGVPATLAARRAAFTGWVGMLVSPDVALAQATAGRPSIAVAMHYHASASDVTFRSGTIPQQSQSRVLDLHNGWTVTTYGTVADGGLLSSSTAVTTLFSGVALSALLAALIYVLATGRVRAYALVSQKTVELRHQALHDTLTELPNRALIVDRIERMLIRSRRSATSAAALYVDLDDFKNVNDTLGHEAGDRLLQAVAARLSATLRDADTIGRMGGDEFVVLVEGATLDVAPELVAERILAVMREPFDLGTPVPVVVTTSIGIAVGSSHASASDLLREADMALYQAKSAGRNCYEMFRPELGSDTQRRYELEFDLRGALESHQYRLMYQPIYNLDDLSIIGVEALLRWEHPTRGTVQPDDFIPVLEATGQILDVGRWVLREACTQMAAWRARGSDLIVSVNVSARQLDHDVIVQDVRDALTESGLDPAALTIEVTETALMRNVDTTARRLAELKALGIQVAIDDFGTGYSSLSYLQRFPVDCLKIDRSFTGAITRSPESDALIHTLVQLGKDLGLKTLAEGVETTEQLDHLRGEGVSEIQGFLLARPLDADTVESLVLHYSGTPGTPNPELHRADQAGA